MTEESPQTPAAVPVEVAPEATAAPKTAPKTSAKFNNPYIWGLGRRKASVARVRIKPGEGKFIVNKRELGKYFALEKDRKTAMQALAATESGKDYDVWVNVNGGGTTGQAGAISLGVARALCKADNTLEPKLREGRLLSRDARKVERKKYGQRGARRKFQFSKR